ncbi:hypothetical protein BDZ97DRAFT_1758714 [Flammula alnicola]|nr:hypothetical protein BDZ97DRAFT_1758714 [Flammula alnicola]
MTDVSRRTYAQVASPKQTKNTSQPLANTDKNLSVARSNQVANSVPRSIAVNPKSQDKENTSTRTPRERRPSEKVIATRNEQEEAARRQELLDANRAERARRAERKRDKNNGIDRPAQSDDEERPDSVFMSQAVITKPAAQKVALVQRQSKVPPAPAWVQRSELLTSRTAPAGSTTSRQQSISHYRSRSPASPAPRSRRHSHSRSRSRSHSYSGHRGRHMSSRSPSVESPSLSFAGRQHQAHGKRARSPDDDAIAEITANFVKAQKVTEGSGRPKASDYDEVAKEVILTATSIYRCLVSTSKAFPTPSEEAEMIKQAWDRANVQTAQDVPIALSPLIAKVISARGSQIRSEVKAHAVTYVETLYGFESGRGKSIIKENRQLAEELKRNHSGYLYKNPSKETGLYQHPIIQKIVNKSWFNNPRDEGILYVDLFDPLSVEAIALVLTAIECGIDAWATGVKLEVSFYSSEYKSIYLSHVKTLKAFGIATSKHDLLGKLQRSLFNFGRIHAGVSSTTSQNGPMLSDSAFTAALREYEEDTETEEDGEDLD